jgi:putative ubiquitin-RnfH superfamily antitoxin RatB of RatAB toxin-antitoxin module
VSAEGVKCCTVAYATREVQYLWQVMLPASANIAAALAAARAQAPDIALPWDEAPVGIFGERRARTDVPLAGDRIEIYRALPCDPREERRARAREGRRAARRP